MSDSEIWLLYSTFPSGDEAISAARALLEKKLVACANISSPITSLYHWQGKLEQSQEVALLAKTAAGQVDKVIAVLKELHPYELPCVVAYPASRGFAPFLAWVEAETALGG